jgi:hypothetical protein
LSHHGGCHGAAEQPDQQPGQAVPCATMRRCGQGAFAASDLPRMPAM